MTRDRGAAPPSHRRLDALYAKLPKLRCAGKCQAQCGVIPMTAAEWRRIAGRLGGMPDPAGRDGSCPLLTATGRCSVYEIRPLVCRLFGAVRDPLMACPHGCEPERWLTEGEARELIAAVTAAGGEIKILGLEDPR